MAAMTVKASNWAAVSLLLGCFLLLLWIRPGDESHNQDRFIAALSDRADPAGKIVECLVSPPVDDGYYGVEKCLSDVKEGLMSNVRDQIKKLPAKRLQRFQGHSPNGWLEKWRSLDLLQPTYTCNPQYFLRTAVGDGGKWMCTDMLEFGKNQECTIFSIGSDGNFGFEQAMKARFPQCQIHTFDCTGSWNDTSTTFHPWCIGGEDKIDATGRRFLRMSSIVKELGISGITLLKIDVENYEWPFFYDLKSQDPRTRPIQVLVEIHTGCPVQPQHEPFNLVPSMFAGWNMNWAHPIIEMMQLLKSLGYRIAFQEKNPMGECASEFVLIHERGL